MGFAVAEALQIKALSTNVQPWLPTRELFPGKPGLPKFMHMFCWWLLYKAIEPASLKRETSKWKAANGCKLSKLNLWDGLYRLNTPQAHSPGRHAVLAQSASSFILYSLTCDFSVPQICGFSPTSFAPPADWDSQGFDYSITGDWILSADDVPETLDAALVQFIEAGEVPPLYIGWGSMAHESCQYMTELAVRRCTWPGQPPTSNSSPPTPNPP